MDKEKQFVLWFDQVGIQDTPIVGGKNASLGEMYSNLTPLGVNVPNGFAVTAYAYQHFIKTNNFKKKIADILDGLDTRDIRDLQKRGKQIRELLLAGKFSDELKKSIGENYKNMETAYFENVDVAVRSSATAEDLPSASFAGQQETYLNVKGIDNLLEAIKKCIASLFTDRAISYRHDKGFDHFKIHLSVGVQKMVRSDLSSSGIAFTLDTETGFDKVIVINGTFGLGEYIVQGKVIPDEWVIFKDTFRQGYKPIISRKLGEKNEKLIYDAKGGIKLAKIKKEDHQKLALTDNEVLKLASWCQKIEDHFSKKRGKLQPMDIEWAKDGQSEELFIVQARPETVHSTENKNIWPEYRLKEKGELIGKGISVGTKISSGKVRVIKNIEQIHDFKEGEILVTEMTDPDWEPIMKIASGIVTDKGSRTSHAAIVSRELGIACIVGASTATKDLKTGDKITIDCTSGNDALIYKGKLDFEILKHDLGKIPEIQTQIMVNIGSPDEAFKNHHLPVKGVGLAREEFIIASKIKFHPNALLNYDKLKSKKIKSEIDKATYGYEDKSQFYIDRLAEGISTIAAAFWPHKVIVRFSDFKTNEYVNLIGGEFYEPKEENPMIGWRGTSRYYDKKFKDAFKLELKAFKKAREEFGMVNIIPMVPFCRTLNEAREVIKIMEESGLNKDWEHNKTCDKPVEECAHQRIYMMCEIPSNIVLADQFLDMFDGYSIGSNDLTQLTLGLDRDSGMLAHIGSADDEAVKELIKQVIHKCRDRKKYIGICGQAPSDIDGYAKFLIDEGIESISLNPDTVIKTIKNISENN
jgi:pyruvate,water dikinase